MPLRALQEGQVQGHHLRPLRRRSDPLQGAPRAHGPHRAGRARLPHLVPQGRAVAAVAAAGHLAAPAGEGAVLRLLHRDARGPRAASTTRCRTITRRWTRRCASWNSSATTTSRRPAWTPAADIKRALRSRRAAVEPKNSKRAKSRSIVSRSWDEARIEDRRRQMEEEIKDIEKDSLEQIQALRDALTLLDEKVEKRLLLAEDEYRKLEVAAGRAGRQAGPRHERSRPRRPGRRGRSRNCCRRSTWTSWRTSCGRRSPRRRGRSRARAIKRLEVAEAFLVVQSRARSG